MNVTPFHPSLEGLSDCPIVTAALAYDDPRTGEVHILLINQAIYFEHLENNLLCPMQMRMNDILIDECPKFLSQNPTDDSHSIYFPRDDFRIPLELSGVTQYFPSRTPSKNEYDNCPLHLQHELTYPLPDWDPHSLEFKSQEENMTDRFGNLRENRTKHYDRNVASVSRLGNSYHIANWHANHSSQISSMLSHITNTLNDDEFAQALSSQVNVTLPDHRSAQATTSGCCQTHPSRNYTERDPH